MKKLIIAVLIGLLAYPPFAFAGGAFDSKSFPGLEPDTYDSCIFYWDQGDARFYSDGATVVDGSGGLNSLEQGTAAKQPTEKATYLDFDGTDDYMSQAVIVSHTGLTSADSRCSFATDQSWLAWSGLDFSAYASADGTYEVVVEDSAGKRAKAYLKAVGSGETNGSNLIVNGTMEADSDWDNRSFEGGETNERSDAAAIGGPHGGSYTRHVDVDDSGDGIESSAEINIVEGQLYHFTSYRWVVSTAELVYNTAPQVLIPVDAVNTGVSTTGSWQTVDAYGCGTGTGTDKLRVLARSGAAEWYEDDTTMYPLTDCAATGVHVTTTPGGATEGWATTETDFDYNDITSIEIRKSAFSVTGDLTVVVCHKPDDGRPASDEVILAKMDETNSFMGYGITLDTAGKVVVTASNDGAVNDNFITDAAVYADGAQASFSLIGFSYDASESNIDIYVAGAEVASTEANDVSTAIYNTADAFDIGRAADGNYFTGNVAIVLVFNDVLTAAEHQQIYYQLKRRFGL